jgi:hypothetical protein
LEVGKTTISFGVARYGPLAPVALKFGKYDSFISTGTLGFATSNETESFVITTLLIASAPYEDVDEILDDAETDSRLDGPFKRRSTGYNDGFW